MSSDQTLSHLQLLGVAYAHPTSEIDNVFIESLDIGTNDAWITEKIGIKRRLSSLPIEYIRETKNRDISKAATFATHSVTDLAVEATEKLLNQLYIPREKIALLVLNTCTPALPFIPEAERVSAKLGLNCISYDILTACPAFALHLHHFNQFRLEELPEYILGICSATMTQRVNYSDRTDAAIWSDGAAAYLLSARHPGKLEIVDSSFSADGTRCEAVVVDASGYFHQDGRAVRDFSVRQTVRMLKQLEERYALDWNRDVFIGHQANATMLEQITSNRKIPAANHWSNATMYGNQAAAGAPIVLSQNWHKLTPGMNVAVCVLGAGLSWGSVLLRAK
jgi:3-oxoacyl-[acyl-carrier-protein] synthase-3